MKSIQHFPGKKLAGIYGIIHLSTSRIYVGSAMNIPRRWQRHLSDLTNKKHPNLYLQSAWNKYGVEAFTWVILEEVTDASQLVLHEQHWIDFYQAAQVKTGFNISPTAGSCLGRKNSPEREYRYYLRKPPRTKLTEENVRIIKARLARGETCVAIAKEYNVISETIQDIKNGKSWIHITGIASLSALPEPPTKQRKRRRDIDDWYQWLSTDFLSS